MAFKFNPLTGKLDLIETAPIEKGTVDGQLVCWDVTLQKWIYTDSSTTKTNFTLQSDYDGTLRHTLRNTSTGTGNLTSYTIRNDAGHRSSFNMAGENNSFLPAHSSILYNEGYGPTGFVSDGAQDFVWYTDPTDSHNMIGAINNEAMRLSYDGRLTIGTGETTDYPLQVFSNFAYGISAQGGINIDLVDRPADVLNAALTIGGSVDAGLHHYKVTYVTIIGETDVSQPVAITTDVTNNAVQLTNIPVSTDPRVLYRKIYRSKAGATNDTGYFLVQIYNNTTTEYLDTVADSTLTGKLFDGGYRPNTTSKFFTIDGIKMMSADKNSTVFGLEAAKSLSGSSAFTTAFGRQALYSTDAFANTALGHSAGYANTTGQDNIYVGYLSGRYNTTGSYSVIIGDYASLYPTVTHGCVAIGFAALRGVYGTSTSSYNTAIGFSAGRSIVDGTSSVYIGYYAGYNASQKTDASNCMCLGRNTYADADGMFVYGDNTVVKHIFQSGNVGYGTDDPQRKLDIRGDGIPCFRITYTPSVSYVDFSLTSSGYYKIEPTGNRTGVNCTPLEALDIDGNVNLNNQFTQVAGETNPGYYLYKNNNLAYGMKLHYVDGQFGNMLFTGNSSNTFLGFGRSPASGIADDDFVEFARFERNTGFFGINETSPNSYLDVNGDARIGDSTTNYTEFKSDGELELHGTARVYKNEWIIASALKAPGIKPATYVDWGIDGGYEFSDGIDDTLSTTLRIPSDMDKTVAPEFKVGFASATNTGDVVWQLEYLYSSVNEDTAASAQETLTTTTTISTTVNGLTIATITGMDLPSTTDQLITLRIKRLGADASDTLSDDCVLLGCGMKYVMNKLGQPT